jgi:beta-lactamase superfamily II metal-dependent hydrolase
MFRVTFINVGYGDAILLETVETDQTFRMLVDGGVTDPQHFLGHPQRIPAYDFLNSQRIEHLDLLVITHLHEDHVTGLLPIAEHLSITECWSNYLPEGNRSVSPIPLPSFAPENAQKLNRSIQSFNRILQALHHQGTKMQEISRSERNRPLSTGTTVDILVGSPPLLEEQRTLIDIAVSSATALERIDALIHLDALINLTSLVLRIRSHGVAVLLGGDVYASYWDALLSAGVDLSADLLKLPHHGHGDSASFSFARAVKPAHVVVCVSNDRPDNCPNPEILSLFASSTIHFTDSVWLPPYTDRVEEQNALVFTLNEEKTFHISTIPPQAIFRRK